MNALGTTTIGDLHRRTSIQGTTWLIEKYCTNGCPEGQNLELSRPVQAFGSKMARFDRGSTLFCAGDLSLQPTAKTARAGEPARFRNRFF